MSHSDPIAHFLTKVRNAIHAKHRYVDIGHNGIIANMIELLRKKGFIDQYLVHDVKPQKMIRIFLKYTDEGIPVIQGLKRISSPGCRKYIGVEQIPYVFDGLGIAIISTSRGVIDGKAARAANVGGELLCAVW